LLLLGLTGCSDTPDQPTPPAKEEWKPSVPEVRDLRSLLTAAEVTAAVGQTVGEGVLQEHDTVLLFSTEDYATQVSLLVEDPTVPALEYLDILSFQYPMGALVEAPNLGDKAFWCAESGELLVATGNCLVAVNVNSMAMDGESRLLAARQLASLVIGRV
jgi:hypothetical protein